MTGTPRPRVLLADDYTELLATFERLLAPSCDVVGCVTDGDALLTAIAVSQPDVIVLDLFIPPSNGIETCRHIKHVSPDTPVIIVSASSDADLSEAAMRAGASAFIPKFLATAELLPAIQKVTSSRSVLDRSAHEADRSKLTMT